MATARIYKPKRSPTQSGMGHTSQWVLEFLDDARRINEPLMGWVSATETQSQVRLTFDTKEDAIAYAEKNGLSYSISDPGVQKKKSISYSANFSSDRLIPWTH